MKSTPMVNVISLTEPFDPRILVTSLTLNEFTLSHHTAIIIYRYCDQQPPPHPNIIPSQTTAYPPSVYIVFLCESYFFRG